eukprot:364003-Chlamydomonas_euryale.AAC.39
MATRGDGQASMQKRRERAAPALRHGWVLHDARRRSRAHRLVQRRRVFPPHLYLLNRRERTRPRRCRRRFTRKASFERNKQ